MNFYLYFKVPRAERVETAETAERETAERSPRAWHVSDQKRLGEGIAYYAL